MAKSAPTTATTPATVQASELGAHALDRAPIHAKLVVVATSGRPKAVLSTPSGAEFLPEGDPAHQLPEGARIRRDGVHTFVAEQLSPAIDRRPLVTRTAEEAIALFIPHFHGDETDANRPEGRHGPAPKRRPEPEGVEAFE